MTEDDDDIQVYKKPWVGLTRDEQSFVYDSLLSATSRKDSFWVDFANAIEQRLKEKNT
jgi:predicted transcriptional regulator